MRSIVWHRLVGAACGLAVGTAALAAPAAGAPVVPRRPRAMNLFSSSGLLVQVNRQQCGITSKGEVCVAFQGSPVGGGGFWPKGTPDQYIFNSGLWIAGLVSPAAGFAWAGDTTGAFFFDAQGDQDMGDPIQPVFDYLNPIDAAAWPNGAVVRDASLYNSVLLGLDAISQGDAWTRYWEGNPIFLNGRTHPMGILVDQRALAWNYPSGNEDIIYFVFTFYNVSAKDRAVYTNATIPPAIQDEIAAVGVEFQRVNEARFNVAIPDGGYTVTDVYASFAMDADVANAGQNYATAFLPFDIGSIYTGDWLGSPGWVFPPDIFSPPDFAAAPGFIGVKYLRAPSPLGLTMFSQTYNPNDAIFDDPTGVKQMYRYQSGFMGGSDGPCNPFPTYAIARTRRLCYLGQTDGDARFYQSSGPFDLAPGEARTIVVAYINAAPTAAVTPYIGGNLPPGIPFTGDSIFFDRTKIRTIERIAGWVSENDANGDQIIQQSEVTTTPRSLLNKALVAQAVYDNKFLLPFAPAAPQFFLVPGDNEVTVVWQRSPTETVGDPFFAIASQPQVVDPGTGGLVPNALYDPNFRKLDVEGYRIYKGRTANQLQLVAQFDYAGTTFKDYTGAIDYGDADGDGAFECAPELGLQDDCPITFGTTSPYTDSTEVNLIGQIIQIPPGGRTELVSGGTINLRADTAVTGGASGFPPLRDNGVAFSYVDRDVRNSFTYSYVVTAFDVNSFKSTPTSLESPRVAKRVTPRVASGQEAGGGQQAVVLRGGDGSTLNPSAALPLIDPATGIFAGPMPATNGLDLALSAFLPGLLGTGALDVTIDSVVPGMAELDVQPGSGRRATYHMTALVGGNPVRFTVALPIDKFADGDSTGSSPFEATALDSAKSARFGGNQTYSLYGVASLTTSGVWRLTSWGRGNANGDPANSDFNGPRWWAGAPNENTPDPNGTRCFPSAGGCVPADLSRNAGSIAGVDIFHPSSYQTTPNAPGRNIEAMLATVVRAADFRVTWGAAGAVSEVFDLTHRVAVPFSPKIRASWGILNQASFAATTAALTRDANNALLTWSDIFCVDPAQVYTVNCGAGAQTPAVLQNTAALSPIAFQSATYAGTAGLAANGNGFILYLSGHFFLMRMAALPTAGTVWYVRYYAGVITGSAAGGNFAFTGATRPAAVPGLRAAVQYEGSTLDQTAATDLSLVHTVPDPYYVTNALETTANTKILKFVNLPSRAIIRIYSVSGILVNVLVHNDVTGGGETTWNLRNRNNQFVASGVYFFHVETPGGTTKVGRFTVINFAP